MLIEALFFEGLSERAYSERSGIPQKTVNDRKNRILKNYINFWKNNPLKISHQRAPL